MLRRPAEHQKRVKILRARPRKPKAVVPIRTDLRTPQELRAELKRVFPDGVHRAAFCEQLRRGLEDDDGHDIAVVCNIWYWKDPEVWSGPELSEELRAVWGAA